MNTKIVESVAKHKLQIYLIVGFIMFPLVCAIYFNDSPHSEKAVEEYQNSHPDEKNKFQQEALDLIQQP